MIKVECPHCKHLLTIPAQFAGQRGDCNFCQQKFTIPVQAKKSKWAFFSIGCILILLITGGFLVRINLSSPRQHIVPIKNSEAIAEPREGDEPFGRSAKLQSIVISRTHDAVRPTSRNGRWMEHHDSLNKRVSKGDWDLLMIGDSITNGWRGVGKKVWAEYYGDRKALNLGIGSDRTQHVLWRLDNGNIDGLDPKVAILMIGTNNLWKDTSEEIAEGITAIVQKLDLELPHTKILLLGILPRRANPAHKVRTMITEVNKVISKLADGKRIHYLDIGDAFLTDKGIIPKEMMPDFIHLTEEGYKKWAEEMEPTLKELLGE